MAESWEAARAAMTPDERFSALAAELNRADSALALFPRSRRWRAYRAQVWAAMQEELASDPAPPLSDDELAAALADFDA